MKRGTTILVGDIGGTNVRFGLASSDDKGRWAVNHFAKYPGDDFPNLEDAIEKYLSTLDTVPQHMSLAIAGPIKDGAVTLTNRAWSITEAGLKALYGMTNVGFFNDFEAMARSVPELSGADFQTVHSGQAMTDAPILVAGAGTGFGVAYLLRTKSGWKVLGSEGGHVAYAPRTREQMAVHNLLANDYGYVSLELVSSGSGLWKVHRAVCQRQDVPYQALSPDEIRSRASNGCELCLEVCQLRSHAIMGALGDLALAGGTRGGIVLAGGVTERMIDFLKIPDAMAVYLNRGSRSDYVKNIPIRMMTNPIAPLIGAAALYKDSQI